MRNRGYPSFGANFGAKVSKDKFPVTPRELLPKADSVYEYAGGFNLPGPFGPIAEVEIPDYYAWFRANLYYNCIEVDAIYPRTDHGWNVPDVFKLATDTQDKMFGVVAGFGGYYGDFSVPRITYEFGVSGTIKIPADQYQFVFQPAKTYYAPTGAGDLTNTSSLYGKQVFRLYGCKPFRSFVLAQWSQYRINHTLETSPELSFRVWYDPDQQILRSVT